MKQLLILSGKGGTGKTTFAAAFIRLAGAKAFADCDVDAPNLHLILAQGQIPKEKDFFGLKKAEINQNICNGCGLCEKNCRFNAIKKNVVNLFDCEGCGVCEEICPLDAVTMKDWSSGDLMLYCSEKNVFSTAKLKMGSGVSGKLVTEVKRQLLNEVTDQELAIIDGSPGIGCPVIASVSGVDMVLIVAEPSLSGISDLGRIIKTAQGFGVMIAVCVNKFDLNIKNTEMIEKLCQEQGIPFLGRVPYDPQAVKIVNSGKTIVDQDSPASDGIKLIYDKVRKLLINEKENE